MPRRLLDLFCGRWGWSRAFAARGWECVGVDLVQPPLPIPHGCEFVRLDVLEIERISDCGCCGAKCECAHSALHQPFDFIVASSPCEQFSVHGMKHFHPNPPYPEMGIKLFNHTRQLCEASGVPYVMENVRAAQQFVGNAVHHCGPFYLWGNAVPPILNQGISKGTTFGLSRQERKATKEPYYSTGSKSKARKEIAAKNATIPPELANCVADYAERILEQKEAERVRSSV